MGKVKAGLLAVTGAVIGVVTLRKLRKRRSEEPIEEAVSEGVEEAKAELEETGEDIEEAAAENIKEAKEEAITAAKHAGGAVKHAGLAAGKAIEAGQEKAETRDTAPEAVNPD